MRTGYHQLRSVSFEAYCNEPVFQRNKILPEHSVIEVRTTHEGNTLTLSVKDTGIGIPKEDQEHLFERFFRANNVSNIQGTGLGLHIINKYAELMDGTIECISEPGQGTQFIVTLKIHKAKMKTVLLIEDNNEIRENMAEILELANYNVLTAPDGKQGVAVATEKKPDLIVCDIMMPVVDGYGVLHMLHKNPELQNIPFIFLTAKAERAEIRKGMELGADDYITKPFSGTELLNAIESRIRKVELAKQQFSSDLTGLNSLIQVVSGPEALKAFIKNRDVNTYKKKQLSIRKETMLFACTMCKKVR